MKYYLFIFVALWLSSCHSQNSSSEQVERVKYEGPTISSLRPFIQSIEAIKLDQGENVTLGAYCVVRQEDSCFYIGDFNCNRLIYRFNRKGQFLDSIGKIGRGAGEYLSLTDFYIDPQADELSILSNPDARLCRYRKNGEFIDQKNIPERVSCFVKQNTHLWFYQGFNNGQYPERLIQVDTSLQLIGKYLPFETKTIEPSIGPLFTQRGKDIYLFNAFDPTIYQITKDSVFPFLQFDYGSYAIQDSYWKAEKAMEAFMELSQKGFISMRSFMLNDDYIITEQNQQAGQNETENYYICGIKNRLSGKWDWIRQQEEGHMLILNNQQAPKVKNRPDWYACHLHGFTQDGKLMAFLFGHELEYLTPEDKNLIQNPEVLENADPEADMFLFLLTLK